MTVSNHQKSNDSAPTLLSPGFSLTLRPMKYPKFFDYFRIAYVKNNWTVQEISFQTDLVDLREKLSPAERHIINRLVAFFATGDNIVANNAALVLYRHVNSPEARMYYARQTYEESLHVDFYLTLLDEYVPDLDERNAAFAAINNVPSIKKKADFCFKWMDQMASIDQLDTDEKKQIFLMNLIAFAAAVEGLFFFAAFAYVYYLRDRGLLHGLGSGTNWVFRDESMHMQFAFDVIDVVRREEPWLWEGDASRGLEPLAPRVVDMLKEAIDCEMTFAEDVLSLGVVGMSPRDMREYLQYTADGHCRRLGMPAIYGSKCPFDFMLKQDIQSLTSFFERTVSDYTMGVTGKVALDENDF